MEQRNLSGMYFRIKRNDRWLNICFEDLTDEEQNELLETKNLEFTRGIAIGMAKTLRKIGDQFDIMA